MKVFAIAVASVFTSPALFCSAPANAASASSSSAVSGTSGSNSSAEVSFTGSGSHQVNGDMIEVRDNTLFVNGASYGKVSDTSVVKYSVKGEKRVLTVDGVARQPVR